VSKLIRIENGSVGISVTDLRALLAYYNVTAQEQVERLVAAARVSKVRPWWHEYHELIRPQYAQLIEYEEGASRIRVYHPTVIPALLQTARYAHEVKSPVKDEAVRSRLVDLLIGRQRMLEENDGTAADFIVDESALIRPAGGKELMVEQLSALLDAMKRSNYSIRVLPLAAGLHPGISGPFILLDLPDGDGNVIFLEGATDDIISREDGDPRERFAGAFQCLTNLALSPEDSAARIAEQQAVFAGA
jgi:hypothetical protein